jgi:hypothetical protein
MAYHVEVNTNSTFGTLAYARGLATSIQALLKSGETHHGAVKIYETDGKSIIPHLIEIPVVDKSKIVVGGQEAEDEARKIIAYLEKNHEAVNDVVSSELFWESFTENTRKSAAIDYEVLESLALARFGASGEGAIPAAVGAIAAKTLELKLATARNVKAKAERVAQNTKKKS